MRRARLVAEVQILGAVTRRRWLKEEVVLQLLRLHHSTPLLAPICLYDCIPPAEVCPRRRPVLDRGSGVALHPPVLLLLVATHLLFCCAACVLIPEEIRKAPLTRGLVTRGVVGAREGAAA